MKTQSAIDHFGSREKLAEKLGIDTTAIYHWKEDVPLLRQYQLEVLTNGALKAGQKKNG